MDLRGRIRLGRIIFLAMCSLFLIAPAMAQTAGDEVTAPEGTPPAPAAAEPALPGLAQPPTDGPSAVEAAAPNAAADAAELPQVTAADALSAARAFADAKLLAEDGYLAKALDAYETALQLDGRDPYAHLEKAQFLVYMSQVSRGERRRAGHLTEAAHHALQARSLSPGNADVLRQYAQIHLRLVEQNQYESIPLATEAFEALRERQEEEDLQVLTSLGQLYLWQRQGEEAAEVLRKAADLRPNFPTVQVMLVEALLGSEQKLEAEKVLANLLELDPRSTEHRLRLAELRSERGDHDGAVSVLQHESVDLAASPRLRQVLARELHLSGDNDAALVLTDSLLTEKAADASGLHRLRVAIFSSLGRYREAIDSLRPLIQASADDVARRVQDLGLLSRLLERVGEPLEAADALQRILGETSLERREMLRAKMALVALWERHGMAGQALDLLRRELDAATAEGNEQDQVIFARLLSDVYRRAEQPQAAHEILQQVAESLPEERVLGRQTLALHNLPALMADERWEEAEASARLLLESDDADVRHSARIARSRALAKLDRLDEALVSLQPEDSDEGPVKRRLLADRLSLLFDHDRADDARAELDRLVTSETPEDYYFAAQVLQGQTLYGAAIPMLDKVLEARPDSVQALFLMGAAKERLGDRDGSVATFERLLELAPNHAPSLNYLGYMWVEGDEKLDDALRYIQRAVAFEPDNGAYVDSLGWALFKLGRYEEAEAHLQWAAKLIPEDPTIFEHLGDLYVVLEDPEQAKASYREAIELGGDEVEEVRTKLRALMENDS